MIRRASIRLRLLAGLGLLLTSIAAGCGGGEEESRIPQANARALVDGLDQADEQFREGDCDELVGSSIPDLEAQVQDLPETVGTDLRAALTEGVGRLARLARDCEPPEPEPTIPEPTPTLPTEPTTPPPTTAPTEPETQTETETETEEEEPPEDEDGNNGNGGPNSRRPPGGSGDGSGSGSGGAGQGGDRGGAVDQGGPAAVDRGGSA